MTTSPIVEVLADTCAVCLLSTDGKSTEKSTLATSRKTKEQQPASTAYQILLLVVCAALAAVAFATFSTTRLPQGVVLVKDGRVVSFTELHMPTIAVAIPVPALDNTTTETNYSTSGGSASSLSAVETPTPNSVEDNATELNATGLRIAREWCIAHAPYACENRGTEFCRWSLLSPYFQQCSYMNYSTPQLPNTLLNRSLVFHGDSTLREVVGAVSTNILRIPEGNVLKSDANMSSRAVVSKTSADNGVQISYRFDYTFDHLRDALPPTTIKAERPDAVVVGIGLYLARSIARNSSIHVNVVTGATEFTSGTNITMQSVAESATKSIVDLVCDQYKAPVGFFAATWMECGHLKHPYRAKKARMSYQQCTHEHSVLKEINAIVQRGLDNYPPRLDGCRVHYLSPIKCSGQKHACLTDGVHTRYGGFYANSKAQVVMNAIYASSNTS